MHEASPPAALLASAFTSAPNAVVLCTATGVVQHANPAFADLVGVPAAALRDGSLFELTHPDDRPAAHEACEGLRAGHVRVSRLEARLLHAEGHDIAVLVSTTLVRDAADVPSHLVMHIDDIRDRKVRERQLVHDALHDPLTGLPNRTLLMDRLEQAIAAERREPTGLAFAFIDVDDFKSVNDSLGHGAGDELLSQLARRAHDLLRPADTLARFGGDEFALLFPASGAEAASTVAERICGLAREPFVLAGTDVASSVSVGLSLWHQDEVLAGLVRRADRAMYAVKRAGGDGWRLDES